MTLKAGKRVLVTQGAGLDSGRIGIVLAPHTHSQARIAQDQGDYKPDFKRESLIMDDKGKLFTMFDSYLRVLAYHTPGAASTMPVTQALNRYNGIRIVSGTFGRFDRHGNLYECCMMTNAMISAGVDVWKLPRMDIERFDHQVQEVVTEAYLKQPTAIDAIVQTFPVLNRPVTVEKTTDPAVTWVQHLADGAGDSNPMRVSQVIAWLKEHGIE